MAKVIWTEPALKDLRDIITHIAEVSMIYAERFGIHTEKVNQKFKDAQPNRRI